MSGRSHRHTGWFPPGVPVPDHTTAPMHWRAQKVLDRLDAGYPLRCADGKAYFAIPAADGRKASVHRVKLELFCLLRESGVIRHDEHERTRYVRVRADYTAQRHEAPLPPKTALELLAPAVALLPAKVA
jgi:hypothetical protein